MSKLSLESLEKSEVKVTLVQAVRVRQYARAAGILAKTDRIDAKVLAAFGSAMQPQPTSPLSAEQKRLRQYEAQRRQLSRILVAEENRLAQLSCTELRTLSRSLISKIKTQIKTLDRGISDLIAQDQTLCVKAQNSPLSAESVYAPQRSCLRKCPSLANSIVAKLPRSPAWRHLITTVDRCAANAPSLVVGPLCVAASTWPHSPPPASIRSCRAFTNVCAPKANRTNWPASRQGGEPPGIAGRETAKGEWEWRRCSNASVRQKRVRSRSRTRSHTTEWSIASRRQKTAVSNQRRLICSWLRRRCTGSNWI